MLLKPALYRKDFIHIHIPRTGGTSLNYYLKGGGHSTIQFYFDELSREEFDRAFKFSFMRDPWDRFVSAINYGIAKDINIGTEALPEEEYLFDFDDILDKVLRASEDEYAWWQTGLSFSEELMFKPQSYFLHVGIIIPMNFIGNIADYERGWQYVQDHIGYYGELKHINKSMNPRQFEKTPERLEKIFEIYRDDYDLISNLPLISEDFTK